MGAPAHTSVSEAAEELVAGMKSGRVRTRSGDVYKPSAIRSYAGALRDHVIPHLGPTRLGDVQRRDVQRIADELLAQGRDPSTIRNALMPLRVIFRRAVEDGDVTVNPCTISGFQRFAADASGSHRRKRRSSSWPCCPNATARSGRRRSTPACAAVSSWRSAGRRLISRQA